MQNYGGVLMRIVGIYDYSCRKRQVSSLKGKSEKMVSQKKSPNSWICI